ncbi:MAG: hypothetical protein IJ215_01315, partial [Clostridia bacterium]|nr:hypothetical protein [Clostridia bacterium]
CCDLRIKELPTLSHQPVSMARCRWQRYIENTRLPNYFRLFGSVRKTGCRNGGSLQANKRYFDYKAVLFEGNIPLYYFREAPLLDLRRTISPIGKDRYLQPVIQTDPTFLDAPH